MHRKISAFPPESPSPWQIIRQNKRACAAAVAIGLTAGTFAKYLAAALLVLWLVTGGSGQ